jgi:hypothetical protein
MHRTHRIVLTSAQRQDMETILRGGTHPAHQSRHARLLLEADEGVRRLRRTDAQVGVLCGVSARTVARVRRTFAEEGLKVALEGRPRVGGNPKLDAQQAARLIALARSQPPTGYAAWSLRLLARSVELVALPPLSHETVRVTLKKTAVPGTGSSAG